MSEWKPVNPCPNCIDSKGGCSGSCDQKWDYQAEVAGQKKLLEYLIADATPVRVSGRKSLLWFIPKQQFEAMLEELK